MTLLAVVNRLLGIEEVGRFYFYLGTATFLSYVLTFGVPDFMLRLAGERASPPDRLVVSGTVLTTAIALLALPLLFPTFSLVAARLGLDDPVPFAAAATGGTLAVMLARPLVETLKGLGRAERAFSLEFVLPSAAALSAAVLIGWTGSGSTWCLPLAHGLGALVAPLWLLALFLMRTPDTECADARLGPRVLSTHVVQLARQLRGRLAEVSHFWAIQVLGASLAFVPYLLGPFLLTPQALGAFATCDRLTGVTSTLGSVMHAVYASQIMSARFDNPRLLKLYFESAVFYFFLSFGLLALFVAKPDFVLYLLGVEEPHAASALVIMAIGRMLASGLGIAELFNKLLGGSRNQVLLMLLAFVLRVAATVALSLAAGLVGLALAVSLGVIVYALSGLLWFLRLAAGRSCRS